MKANKQVRRSVTLPEPTARAEVTRYCAWPTQASAYLTGCLEILRIRDRFSKETGRSLREFLAYRERSFAVKPQRAGVGALCLDDDLLCGLGVDPAAETELFLDPLYGLCGPDEPGADGDHDQQQADDDERHERGRRPERVEVRP